MDIQHIKLAKERLAELENERKAIIDWLDQELVINILDPTPQKFCEDNVEVVATVPFIYEVNEDEFVRITNENPEFSELVSQLFNFKLSVSENWFSASEDIKRIFNPAITTKRCETQYEIKEIGETNEFKS